MLRLQLILERLGTMLLNWFLIDDSDLLFLIIHLPKYVILDQLLLLRGQQLPALISLCCWIRAGMQTTLHFYLIPLHTEKQHDTCIKLKKLYCTVNLILQLSQAQFILQSCVTQLQQKHQI